MMEGLGQSIETSLKDIEGIPKSIRIPGVRIHRTSRKGRKVRKSDIEKIPPERVAKIVSPLGSEERLKILQFLKEGGKSFGEIEEDTQKFGSSLTHHLNPLVDAGYVVKGEVRGTYYLTVEGRLAYRLAQWLTHRVETQRDRTAKNGSKSEGEVPVDFDDDDDEESIVIVEDEESLEEAAEHLERVQDEIEEMQDKLEDAAEEIADAKEEELERREEIEEREAEEDDDLDDFDWED
jgi:DNA-binding transcriptional ArsR family regulator